MLRQIRNYRWNPFTEASAFAVITDEVHAIPPSGTYWVRLNEFADENYTDPTSGTPVYIRTVGGTVFTEVSSAPGLNEFRVDYNYKSGWVEFNSGNADDLIYICYRATGSPTEAELINSLQRYDVASPYFCGDGSDGAVTISVNTALAEDPASSLVAFKQYSSLKINTGITLSLAAGVRGMILCVTGVLEMEANAIIDVNSRGGAAGAAGLGSSVREGQRGGYGVYGGGDGGYSGDGAEGGRNGGYIREMMAPDDIWWRTLAHQVMFGSGGGGGASQDTPGIWGGTGGIGGGFIIINANVLKVAAGRKFEAKAGATTGVPGVNCGGAGGGAGGSIIILANTIIGETASNLQTNDCDVSKTSGQAGNGTGANGEDGIDGYKRVVELYEYNVY